MRARTGTRLAAAGLLLVLAGTACEHHGSATPAPAPAPAVASEPAGGGPGGLSPTGCPPGVVVVDLHAPERSEVYLNVLNASGRVAVGTDTAADLAFRGFHVVTAKEYQPLQNGNVVLRYGPRTVGAAWLVTANFPAPVRAEFDPQRTDTVVDVIIGRDFQYLNTTTEVNQAIAATGLPTAPPGTCGVGGP